jgi:hypothetical protein
MNESIRGERARQCVTAALSRALDDGTEITVAGIARAAGVDRRYIYRHPALLSEIRAHERPRPGMKEQDKRREHVTVLLSPYEAAELDRRIGDTGTRSGFARDALLKELGITDTAKRAAPRGQNREHGKGGK